MRKSSKPLAAVIALVYCASFGVGASSAYTAVDLSPAGSTLSRAFGAGGGQQVGIAATGSTFHAGVWVGTAGSFVDLHPTAGGFTNSVANETDGTKQAGYVYLSLSVTHAALWSGTAASFVDLHPATGYALTQINAFDGVQQAGMGQVGMPQVGAQHAVLWSGTAASFVDLNPAGISNSNAFGVGDGQQVGVGIGTATANQNHALLWTGAAASVIDLNPGGFTSSTAFGADAGRQVGSGKTGGNTHALLWSGTAESVIDLNPADFTTSSAGDIEGVLQVGDGSGTATGGETHALLWSGTAASVIDLHLLLPPDTFTSSTATGVDAAGNVVGYATDANGTVHAMLWAVPEPGTFSVVCVAMAAGVLARRRRRRGVSYPAGNHCADVPRKRCSRCRAFGDIIR